MPIDVVDDVLTYAIQESENDKRARAMLFERLGIELDDSCKSQFDVPPHLYALTPERLNQMIGRTG